jgi:hypothetical protein
MSKTITRWLGRAAWLVLVSSCLPTAAAGQDLDRLLTRAERSNFEETSTYDEVMAFLRTVADASPRIQLTTFGTTFEGRSMPLAVVGDVEGTSPEAVLATGKTRVYLQGNIHAGEVCGKEALLMFLREVAQGQHGELFDSLVLLVDPIYNADGNERFDVNNRPRQNGPIRGMGQRPNAQGYDLNRDHIKLDSPEARALVALMNRYDPHVGVDLHTTDGSRHAYHLTYSPPLHPNTDEAISSLNAQWLVAARDYLFDTAGWYSYDYGNASSRGQTEPTWRTFDYRPRFNNNYIGLRNRFAILSEAYAYATFEERILASKYFVDGILDFAVRNATEIGRRTAQADARNLVGTELAVSARPKRSAEPVEILMGEVEEEANPYSDRTILRRLDVVNRQQMYEYISFEPSETERVPAAYFIPPEATLALERLHDHGVRSTTLTRDTRLSVQVFRIDSTTVASRPFQQHSERIVFGRYRQDSRELPAGTVVVSTDQLLGRLVFQLLEPRSSDGFLDWNILDSLLEGATEYPILRTFGEVPGH